MVSTNKQQALALSYLAEEFLASFFTNKDANINLNFLNFNNDHFIHRLFFKCPGCLCKKIHYCGSFLAKSAIHGLIPIYYCEECGTIVTPQKNNYQTISTDTLEFISVNNALQNHLNFEDRNRKLSRILLNEITNFTHNKLTTLVEVGCGPGWLLDEAQKSGINCTGFDLATESVNYGVEKFKLNLRNEIFNCDTSLEAFDLLVCIMVLEHIQKPDDLASAIAFHCKHNRCPALLSVPITENLESILNSLKDITGQRSLFQYSPGHTCHYTQEGFVKLWHRHGATRVQRLGIAGSWPFLFLVDF